METNTFHEFSVNRLSSISAVLISAIFDLTLFMILYHFLISVVIFRFDAVFQPKDASFFSSEAILYVHKQVFR